MSKINFTKEYKQLYQAKPEFTVLTVPSLRYLMIDGHGDPNSAPQYAESVAALYALSYALKFLSKNDLNRDYVVPPLEGLWWAEDMSTFVTRQKAQWDWTMMILLPDWISDQHVESVRQQVQRKKNPPRLEQVRAQRYDEGLAVQILHLGSYDDEGPILQQLHQQWLPQNGYREAGKHHEIYLSDPRRVEASALKTILRQPITAS
jgi:hypothetical protein